MKNIVDISPLQCDKLMMNNTMKSYNVKPSDMTPPSDQSMTVEKEEKLQKETVPELQNTRLLDSLKVENTTIVGAYAPAYEFDMVTEFKLPNPNEEKMVDIPDDLG